MVDTACYALAPLLMRIHTNRHIDRNVSTRQWLLLNIINNRENVTMTGIARIMGNSTAAATGVVDRLEKLGMISRFHGQNDRRKVYVTVTQRGLGVINRGKDWLQLELIDVMEREQLSVDRESS